MENFRMDWEFGSATDGNVAVMGELDLERAELRSGKTARVYGGASASARATTRRAEDGGRAGHAV